MEFDGFENETASNRRAIVVADAPEAAALARRAAGHAGVTVRAAIGFGDIASELAAIGHADLLLVETAGVATAILDHALPLLLGRAMDDRARMVVAFDAEQIDVVTLHLLGGPVELLCDARMDERVAAVALGGAGAGRVNDPDHDADRERLRRLNDEVARIAEVLARLARDETEAQGGVRDRSSDFAAPPTAAGDDAVAAATVRGAIRARRLRDQFFDAALFADPAWDMLLDLFAARLEGTQVSVSSLCIAAAVPPTTALRWIGTLGDAGLLERRDDPADRRRAFIALNAPAVAGMTGYARAVAQAGLGWA